MARKQPKFEYAIICDDIRQEIGNKLTFVGVYQDQIIVPRFPFTFPKLCFFIQYADVKEGDQFLLELHDPTHKVIDKAINIIVPAGQKSAKMRMFGIYSPIRVEKEGRYAMQITANGNDKKKDEIAVSITEGSESR
jgi:hypothetical protein